VILSDMMMPEMDGQQLYGEIARRWPHIVTRMVFVTAQAEEPSIADFLGRAGTRVVDKPFSVAELRTGLELAETPGAA
jgi:two-component system NtrC family sensor kinase